MEFYYFGFEDAMVAAEKMLVSGNSKEKESEMWVPSETGRLPGDAQRLTVCRRL